MSMFASNAISMASYQSLDVTSLARRNLTATSGTRILVTLLYRLPARSLLSSLNPRVKATSTAVFCTCHTRLKWLTQSFRNVTSESGQCKTSHRLTCVLTIRVDRDVVLRRGCIHGVREIEAKGLKCSSNPPGVCSV